MTPFQIECKNKRIKSCESLMNNVFEVLTDWYEELNLVSTPRDRIACKHEIRRLNKLMKQYLDEREELKNELKELKA